MIRSTPSLALALSLVAAACGGDDGPGTTPDAPPTIDAAPDAPTLPPGCDYAELNDMGNDSYVMGGGREATNLMVSAATTLCGQIDSTHFDMGKVDIDAYSITLAAPSTLTITLTGAGLEGLADTRVAVWSGTDFADPEGGLLFAGNHGIAGFALPAGTYEVAVLGANMAAITAPVSYKVAIAPDMPDTRCPKIAAAANFTEAGDGGGSNGNDVIKIDFAMQTSQSLTAPGNDTPEASGITVAPAGAYRITGSLAEVAIDGSYKDKDTFAFTTDATTNQLEIRLNWTGATDLDYFLFEQTTAVVPSKGASAIAANMEAEFQTFAVKPSTTYLLWAGLFRTSTGPQAYDFSICGKAFTP